MMGISFGVVLVAVLPGLAPGWSVVLLLVLLLWLCLIAGSGARCVSPFQLQFYGLLLGVVYATCWGYVQLEHRLSVHSATEDRLLKGQVVEVEKQNPGYVRFIFAPDYQESVKPRRIQLSWYRPDRFPVPGQKWRFQLRLKPIHGFSNPGGQDMQLRYLVKGIDARGYILEEGELLSGYEQFSFNRWRYQLSGWLDGLSLTQPALATIKALFLGSAGDLNDQQWNTLRQTGTVHLIVISGMHIGILCLFGYGLGYLLQWVLSFCSLATDLRWMRVVPALGFAAGYALLAGFSIPTQRALIMAAALLLPPLFNRNFGLWQRYMLAVTLVSLLQPLSIYQPGFWLSFGAVGGLLLVVSDGAGRERWLFSLVRAQWVICLILLPLLWLWTGTLSLIAPLVNLLAIPYLSFILLPGLVIGLPLAVVSPEVSVFLLELLIEVLWWILHGAGQVVGAVDLPHTPALLSVLLAVLASVLLILPRWLRIQGLSLFLFLPLINAQINKPGPGEFRATIIDVGQGMSVLIETQSEVLLYDTGRKYRYSGSAALYSTIPLLKQRGINKLDRLIISHSDGDHAGGYRDIADQVMIDKKQSGSPEWLARFGGERCLSGAGWQADGVYFRFLQPHEPSPINENNRSCVLLIESDECSLLLTGDIESSVEHQILHQYPELKAKWLVAAHHGSRFSTSTQWLSRLQPDLVLISAGFQNPYGHPAPQMITRLKASGVPWLTTSDSGAITLQARDSSCSATSYRTEKKRYWSAG